MSAFILGHKHIDALLTFANVKRMGNINLNDTNEQRIYSFSDTIHLDELGQILVNQNARSVNYRYHALDIPEEYHWHIYSGKRDPVTILKACQCYDYQACETEDYNPRDNNAARIVEWIRGTAINALPGYDAASWEIAE